MVASMFRVSRVISALRRSQPIAASRALFDQVMRTIRATRARVAASAAALTHKARHDALPPFSGPASAICGIYGMAAGVGSAGRGVGPGGSLASPHLAVNPPSQLWHWPFVIPAFPPSRSADHPGRLAGIFEHSQDPADFLLAMLGAQRAAQQGHSGGGRGGTGEVDVKALAEQGL